MELGVPLWKHFQDQLSDRKHRGLFREPSEFQISSGRLLSSPSGEQLIHFGSNDYLGLSWHPAVRGIAALGVSEGPALPTVSGDSATASSSTSSSTFSPTDLSLSSELSLENRYGAGASPLLAGHSHSHERLRLKLAAFEGSEDAVLFSSGYAANVGTVSALAGDGDVIFSDSLNHASLIDGCRLSKAAVHVYRHNDLAHLEELVRSHRSQARHAFIVTDSLFSMDGDVAELRGIEKLAEAFDLVVIVDEAHATGVFGHNGSGLLAETGCCSERWIKVGTLSKAIGCSGGFVVANRSVTQWLHNFARSYIYSTSIPIPHCDTALKSLELLQSMDSERQELRRRGRWLRKQLRDIGHRVGGGNGFGDESPIVPLYAPDVETVVKWSCLLRQKGLYVPAIRPPTVPADSPLLRISLSTSHLASDFSLLIEACRF